MWVLLMLYVWVYAIKPVGHEKETMDDTDSSHFQFVQKFLIFQPFVASAFVDVDADAYAGEEAR